MSSNFAVQVNDLHKSYGGIVAVNSISFSIKPNEIFALIGPNGAGKSTTLRMIATLLSPTSGSIDVFGHDGIKESQEVRRVISYLPEEAGAYKNMSGRDYLHFMGSLFTQDTNQLKEFISMGEEISGLGDRLKDKIKTYSKGMTRKVLLARTVMTKPKLAILDEPTSGLDVINALEIRRTIKSLVKNGMTVLLSSHNMLEIEYLSDRVGIISQGTIHAIGTPQELKQQYNAANLEEVFAAITSTTK
ncbi:ABC transporter ATP-binding protein [candidate division WWE3 bacterium]|nr:ABC transporter ATP-binding protein [candidate division WWE3 bacterium]